MPLSVSPKTRFLEHKEFVKTHLDVVVHSAFQAAADAAMLQLVAEMPDTTDPDMSAAGYHRILGARQYRRLLESVAEEPKPMSPRRDLHNLQNNT